MTDGGGGQSVLNDPERALDNISSITALLSESSRIGEEHIRFRLEFASN